MNINNNIDIISNSKSYLMRSRTWLRISLFIFKFKLSSSGMILQPGKN